MIDEKKLVERLENIQKNDCKSLVERTWFDGILAIVESQPKVGEWIPVEERMPNYLQKVLVTYIGYFDEKRHCDDVAYREISGQWMWALDDTRVGVEIIAWMPLPEPYQGEEK